jgi:hypothetical protein
LAETLQTWQAVRTPLWTRVNVAAVVAMGDKKWHVDRDDLIGFDMGPIPGVDEVEINIKAEQSLTGAIVQVQSGRPTKVCATRGHGEISLDDNQERSLASWHLGQCLLRQELNETSIEPQSVQTWAWEPRVDVLQNRIILKAFA